MLAYVTKMKCVRLVVFVLLESQMTHYIKKVKKVWNSRSTVPNVNSQLRCANCQQAHSAAYRGCPMFLKQKDIMEIKVNNKISYAEAAGKLKDREFMLTQESTIPKSMISTEASGERVYLSNPQTIVRPNITNSNFVNAVKHVLPDRPTMTLKSLASSIPLSACPA